MRIFKAATTEFILKQSADGKHWYLQGIMSNNRIDRDYDVMDDSLLQNWCDVINNEHLNMFVDHAHDISSSVGSWNKAEYRNGDLVVEGRLEDPEVSPMAAAIIHKLQSGQRIGISIGADMQNSKKEFDGETGRSIRRILDAPLYEASLVGIPANQFAYVTGLELKSFKPYATAQQIVARLSIQKAKYASDFPHTIAFDWNGTVDARNTGQGIPMGTLDWLKSQGKEVIVFTSSTQSDDKLFARKICEAHGIPITDDESILDHADMFVGDKDSDRRRAGQHGAKWVHVRNFDEKKIGENSANDKPEIIGGQDSDSTTNKSGLDYQGLPADGRFVDSNTHFNHYSAECTRLHPGETHSDYESRFRTMQKSSGRNKALPSEFAVGAFNNDVAEQQKVVEQQRANGRLMTGGRPDPNKLLQLRTPMQPASKIAAEPGMSGSSEVFRTDTGSKIEVNGDAWGTRNPYVGIKPTDALQEERKALADLRRWSMEKRSTYGSQSWVPAMNAETIRQTQLAGEDQRVKELEEHRDRQERLHSLGQTHDNTICRHCVGEQPSALTQPKPAPPLDQIAPQQNLGAEALAGVDPTQTGEKQAYSGGPAPIFGQGKAEENGREFTGNPAARLDEDVGSSGMGAVGTGPRFSDEDKEESIVSMRPGGSQGVHEETKLSDQEKPPYKDREVPVGTNLNFAKKKTYYAR